MVQLGSTISLGIQLTPPSIWSVECSLNFGRSTHFDCFDITSAQYPSKEWLPENVSLKLHDAFTPFPSEFHGKYDLVNIRLFLCIVQHDDPSKLIKNLAALLSKWLLG